MQFENESFEHEEIRLDGNEYIDCEFHDCNLKFGGREEIILDSCVFDQCKWTFTEAAENTLGFLTALYHSGEGRKELVEQTFENIKKGEHPKI